jgi:hypothetical protein
MKKLIILSLVTLTALSADAQRRRTRANTSQGNWAVGLEAGYMSNNEDPAGDASTKGGNLRVAPSIGYFVADNLEVGLDLDFGNNTSNKTNVLTPINKTETTTNNTGFGLYVRKYWPVNNWFAFTGNAGAGMFFGNSDAKTTLGTNITNVGSTSQGYRGGVNFGMAFTPVNNIALQSTIGGVNVRSWVNDPAGPSNSVSYNDLSIGLTKQVNFGITWFFGRGLWAND